MVSGVSIYWSNVPIHVFSGHSVKMVGQCWFASNGDWIEDEFL